MTQKRTKRQRRRRKIGRLEARDARIPRVHGAAEESQSGPAGERHGATLPAACCRREINFPNSLGREKNQAGARRAIISGARGLENASATVMVTRGDA